MSSLLAQARSVLACLVLAPALWAGTEFPVGPGESVVPNQLLVRYKAGTALNVVANTLVPNAQVQAISSLPDVYLVQLPPATPASFSTQLSRQATVEYVEHNHIRRASLQPPNDPNYAASQYALQKVQALQAWQLLPSAYLTGATAGTARIKIAILDTGADCTHPDFINSGGSSPDAALGGQILFSVSQALVATTHSPANCSWQDDNGHGTHVSGIVGAATNNGAGVASLGYPVELIEYKVLNANGAGNDVDIASAIETAANTGASVISMSLGGIGYSQTLQDAVNYAWQRNCVVVAAVGNDGMNELFFPAAANHAMGVAATDQNDNRASFSNFGSLVSIAAPGVGILSMFPTYHVTLNDPPANATQDYATLNGTSMATPHVAALAGLIDMATPSLSAMAALQRIERSGDSAASNGGWDQNFGYGRINAFNAISGTLRTASVGGIVGQVVDQTGLPVSSATVAIPGQSPFVTDSIPTGLFRFSNLNAGSTYTITVSATGLSPVNVKAAVVAGADTIVTIVMGAVTGEFHGIVSDGGVPLAGVVVQALSAGLIQATSITDGTGAYSLLVPPGTFDLRASAVAGVTTTITSQSVAANGSTLVNISMARMGSISGTVVDAAGNLVNGAQIIVAAAGFSIGATTSSGSYSTIPVPAGAYSVTLTASGFLSVTATAVVVTNDHVTTVNFTGVTVATNPTGLSILVDGANYTAPQAFLWAVGSNHTIAVNSPQNGTAGTHYAWSNWSDGLAISHNITVPNAPATLTANFTTQYLLTLAAAPGGSGTVTPNPSSGDGYYASGTSVQITATANSGYQFANFSGDLSGATNPQSVAMTAPRSVTGNFTALTAITVTTSPPNLNITVDGTSYTAPQNFNWLPGSNHTLAVISPQNGTAGTRYAWSNWSDAGAISHNVTAPGTPSIYTANFSAQYLLTVAASPGAAGALAANPSSSDGYYASGTSVQITATANSGYQFANFSGDLSGATNPQSVAMTAPRSVTGNFAVGSTLAIDRAKLSFGVANSVATSPQTIQITTQAGVGWTASSNQSNISVSPPSGVGSATLQITAGAGSSGVVTVTAPGATGSPQLIQVKVSSVPPGVPFGSFDTPANNTTGIAGAIPVTGWALDNVEVSHVDIWREPVGNEPVQSNGLVLIGNAVFVAGARPDVEATYPSAPLNYRAGWGYMLLTNFLPNGGGSPGPGNGTYKLHAIATNKTGQTFDLGTRSITVDNAHASKPFGTIDTPAQGGTVSGNAYVNFGWALTQNPNSISTDGSTITVILDGVPVGHPTYNQFRSDIANLFPGLANSNGPVGFFYIDTTKLANGVHTISWNVFDNAGHGDGIGSRYFTVANTGGGNVPVTDEPIESSQIAADGTGVYTVSIEELDRIELPVGATKGYLLVNRERRPLPVGSTLKSGRFYWQAGPGFLGEYDLLFERAGTTLVRVRVKIQPKTYAPREPR